MVQLQQLSTSSFRFFSSSSNLQSSSPTDIASSDLSDFMQLPLASQKALHYFFPHVQQQSASQDLQTDFDGRNQGNTPSKHVLVLQVFLVTDIDPISSCMHIQAKETTQISSQSTIHLFSTTFILSVILSQKIKLLSYLCRQELKHCHWMDLDQT